ncbi:MAG: hypothetical protein R3343_10550 [Nitriliruptorales bacterium]|nr:hypothetical protein [Nitriliruptorales bacterium]
MSRGFFSELLGRWDLAGTVLGRPLEQLVTVERVLGGSWLRLTFHPSTVTPLTDEPYEAIAYIAPTDKEGDEHVMVLMDTFGATSWAPGFGRVEGDHIDFRFDYADGAFRTSFRQLEDGAWVIRQWRASDDGWTEFGVKRLTSAEPAEQ